MSLAEWIFFIVLLHPGQPGAINFLSTVSYASQPVCHERMNAFIQMILVDSPTSEVLAVCRDISKIKPISEPA